METFIQRSCITRFNEIEQDPFLEGKKRRETGLRSPWKETGWSAGLMAAFNKQRILWRCSAVARRADGASASRAGE
jgi:hypothetical protein